MKISVRTVQLELGRHIMRKTVAELSCVVHEIPDDDCKGIDASMGIYRPTVLFYAIERALIARGLLPHLADPFVYFIGVVD